ncbi:MAG: hypothetical protein ACLSB9_03805 [Hydrogeniiclostridium mannosilyticum]
MEADGAGSSSVALKDGVPAKKDSLASPTQFRELLHYKSSWWYAWLKSCMRAA